jgi:3-hydroxypropanoate dehydrogenase
MEVKQENAAKQRIPENAIKQLFSEARTFGGWLSKDVSDQKLHEIYDLMKWGPTSANCCPVRIVFVKSPQEKEKLLGCLDPQNVPKAKPAPVTAILAIDEAFYNALPKLAPPMASFKDVFQSNKQLAESTAFRNSSLQGAYFIMAARAVGLDCGPMSGFDNAKLDEQFFKNTSWKSNFICNIGYGDPSKLHPRLPRFSFDEACKIV